MQIGTRIASSSMITIYTPHKTIPFAICAEGPPMPRRLFCYLDVTLNLDCANPQQIAEIVDSSSLYAKSLHGVQYIVFILRFIGYRNTFSSEKRIKTDRYAKLTPIQ